MTKYYNRALEYVEATDRDQRRRPQKPLPPSPPPVNAGLQRYHEFMSKLSVLIRERLTTPVLRFWEERKLSLQTLFLMVMTALSADSGAGQLMISTSEPYRAGQNWYLLTDSSCREIRIIFMPAESRSQIPLFNSLTTFQAFRGLACAE